MRYASRMDKPFRSSYFRSAVRPGVQRFFVERRRIHSWIIITLFLFQAGCAPADRAGRSRAPDRPLSTAEIVRKLAPSVVKLQVPLTEPSEAGTPYPGNSLGTGVIFDSEGHIVTNLHVIRPGSGEMPDRIFTTLSDRRTFYAGVVGLDEKLDLAVLKIGAAGLTPAAFGDTESLEVGDDVVAVGYAFDLAGPPTVTRGVVSAVHRRILQPGLVIPDAIQTDADIHPGNSGGPLVNSRGEVIGINTAVASWSGDIGFAVSVSILRPAVESILQSGVFKRAYLGISTAESSVQFDLGPLTGNGLPVLHVVEGSPAHAAGLQARDIVVSIGGEQVSSGGDLLPILAKHRPGEKIAVEFYRGGERKSVLATLAEQP
jgi:putative serine protease PepD